MQKKFLFRLLIVLIIAFISVVSLRLFAKSYPSLIPQALKKVLSYKPSLALKEKTSRFEAALHAVLNRLEVSEQDIAEQLFVEDSLKVIRVRIPRGRPLEWIIWDITESLTSTPSRLEDCVLDEKKGICTLSFKSTDKKEPHVRLIIRRSERFFTNSAKLAILIEDFEFQADKTTTDILSFPQPLTISLSPAVKKSAWTAQAADQYKKEVVIELALEPLVATNMAEGIQMIMVHYPEDKIRSIISSTTETIPNFSGFNNLLGSRALEDTRVMNIVLQEMKKRHGYFIEMPAARNSVAKALAAKIGLAYARTSARIPDKADMHGIKDHLTHFCVVAHKRGTVLVTTKASVALVQALNEMRDIFRQNGIRLVYVSEIVK